MNPDDPNVVNLVRVAERLGDLRRDAVFVGGAVCPLLITDPGAAAVRVTQDVDAVVDIATYPAYEQWSAGLRARGFEVDSTAGAPIGRWLLDGTIRVDVMPVAPIFHAGNKR